ncbi:MAG: hypothetical protein ACRCWJ_18835 [Casimicrobium sp.]
MNNSYRFASVGFVLLLLLSMALTQFPKLTILSIIVGLAVMPLMSAYRALSKAKRPSRFRLIRIARKLRPLFIPAPIAGVLYKIAFGMALLGAASIIAAPRDDILLTVFWGIAAFFTYSGSIVEWVVRWKKLRLSERFPKATKASLAFISAVVFFIANSFAKNLTHQITQVDPSSFGDFVRLSTVVFFLLSLVIVVSTILVALSTVQSLLVLLASILLPISETLRLALPLKAQEKNREQLHRLLIGKRLPKNQPAYEKFAFAVPYALSPFATFFLTMALFPGVTWAYSELSRSFLSNQKLQELVVALEYRSFHRCDKVAVTDRVAYLPGEYVSVAKRGATGYVFSRSKCNEN